MTWSRSHTLVTTATPQQLWKRWTTPEFWAVDDPGVQWARFSTPVAPGASGQVKNAGSPAQRFRFNDVRVNERMDVEIRLPFARLAITHAMRETAKGVSMTHGIVLDGPLGGLYGLLLGRRLAIGLPEVVRRVADGALTL